MKKLLMGLAVLTMMSAPAYALIHVEPFVGYAKGEEDSNATNPDDYSGLGYGARVGMDITGFIFGATYEAIGITAEQSGGSEFDFDMTHIGGFLGYEFPLGLRVFGTYYVSAAAEYGGLSGAAGTLLNGAKVKGSGVALGVGFKIIPMVAFNLEYKSLSYDELEAPNGNTTNLSDAGTQIFMASISVPLGF